MEDGLKTKEIAVAQKSFAPEFSISIYSLPFASGLLKQIMEGITFQSIQPDWKGMKTKGNVTSLEVRFTLAGGQEEKSMIAFNESGKILFVDYFDRLFGDSRYRKSSLAAVLPFRIEGGSIILSARLNDSPRVMSFLLDTGANYYLIAFSRFVRQNRLLLSGFKPEGSGATVSLGHSTPVFYGHARSLKVGSVVSKNVPVTLQASTGGDSSNHTDVDGSIGIQFFSDFNFTIDLLRKVVHLSPRKKLK